MKRFLVRLFGPSAADPSTPALISSEVVTEARSFTGGQSPAVAHLDHIPDGPVSEDFRPQVAVGTARRECDGSPLTIWADVELSHGMLRPAGGTWTCSPAEFARRFGRREARYLDGERVVMAAQNASAEDGTGR